MANLFQNKKQKIAWIIYVILNIYDYSTTISSNNNNPSCYLKGHCTNPLIEVVFLTIVFTIIAFILQDKKDKNQK